MTFTDDQINELIADLRAGGNPETDDLCNEAADALAQVKAERDEVTGNRDEFRNAWNAQGFEIIRLEAKNASLRDAIREALDEHDPLHGASEGLHCGGMAPCIRRILSAALDTEKGD